jgi:hypothetical protein
MSSLPQGGANTYPGMNGGAFMNTAQRLTAGNCVQETIQDGSGVGMNLEGWLWKVLIAVGAAFLLVSILNFIRTFIS